MNYLKSETVLKKLSELGVGYSVEKLRAVVVVV